MTGLSEKAFFPGEQIGSAGGVDGTSDGIGSPHSFAPLSFFGPSSYEFFGEPLSLNQILLTTGECDGW